jgi:hypothetical protein
MGTKGDDLFNEEQVASEREREREIIRPVNERFN